MTKEEAKEILVKAHMCLRKPFFAGRCIGRKNCENCKFNVTYEQEKEAYNYLLSLTERIET